MIGAAQALERRMLRRTRIVVAVNLAAALSVVIVLVGGLAYLVVGRQQDSTAERFLAKTVATGEPGVRYSCLWLFTLRGDDWGGASAAPPGFPLRDTMRAVAISGRTVEESVPANGRIYRVRTERAGDEVRQAVFDSAYQQENHRQLLAALLLAGLAGLVGSATVGAILSYRAIDPLAEALARQRRFVADASHELRAPLTRLHTRTQLILRREKELPDSLTAELQRLADGTRELGEVIDDLLRSARLRSESAESDSVDLTALVADIFAAEAGRLAEGGLVAGVAVVGPEPVLVAGVRPPLRRMVSTLVDNAIGHTPPGGRIDATISMSEQGRMIELVIADTGVGLDESIRDEIFERYVHGSAGNGQRHGIGLALAREVVDSHGGTIAAASRPTGGTEFTVRLPAAPPTPGERSKTVLRDSDDAVVAASPG